MKLELKRISHNERLSQETFAFAADIWIDGKKVGDVRNDGNGGCHMFSPWGIEDTLDEYGKTLPKKQYPQSFGGSDYSQDAESLINDLVEDHLIAKDLKRLLSKRVAWVENNAIYQSANLKTKTNVARGIEFFKEKGKPLILNTLPFDEALTLYKQHG